MVSNRFFWKHSFVHLYLCESACPMMLGNGAMVVRDSVCAGRTGGERKARGTLELFYLVGLAQWSGEALTS